MLQENVGIGRLAIKLKGTLPYVLDCNTEVKINFREQVMSLESLFVQLRTFHVPSHFV